MTTEQIAELRRLYGESDKNFDGLVECLEDNGCLHRNDAAFMIAANKAMPELLAAWEEREAVRMAARKLLAVCLPPRDVSGSVMFDEAVTALAIRSR